MSAAQGQPEGQVKLDFVGKSKANRNNLKKQISLKFRKLKQKVEYEKDKARN